MLHLTNYSYFRGKNYGKITIFIVATIGFNICAVSMADSDEDVEEVVVTGSRITNTNVVSTSQVQVVTAEDIDNRVLLEQ